MSDTAAARLAVLGAAALFSTGGAAIKAVSQTGIQTAGIRSGIAALVLWIYFRPEKGSFNRDTLAVSLAYAATLIGFVAANKWTTSANSIFLQDTAPLYILALGPWLLRERVRLRDLGLMLVIAAGMSLFFFAEPAAQATAPNPRLGNLVASATGISWALTLLGLRWLARRPESDGGAGAVVLGNALAFVLCLPWMFPLSLSGPTELAVLIYLGVFQIGLAYVLITRAAPRVPALELSLLLLLEPALNPIWSFFVHGENPGSLALLGGGLIMAGTLARAVSKETG